MSLRDAGKNLPQRMEGRANPLESMAASLRDPGKNYPRSIRKRFAGTIVETRSRTEEEGHTSNQRSYTRLPSKGYCESSDPSTSAPSFLRNARMEGGAMMKYRITPVADWQPVPHSLRRYRIISDGIAQSQTAPHNFRRHRVISNGTA